MVLLNYVRTLCGAFHAVVEGTPCKPFCQALGGPVRCREKDCRGHAKTQSDFGLSDSIWGGVPMEDPAEEGTALRSACQV